MQILVTFILLQIPDALQSDIYDSVVDKLAHRRMKQLLWSIIPFPKKKINVSFIRKKKYGQQHLDLSEKLKELELNTSVFWNITPCSQLTFNRLHGPPLW
jgi:hypothetical protein